MLDKQGHMHVRACTHSRALAHTRARKHTNMQYFLLLHGNNDSQTRLSVTLYAHCLSSLLLKIRSVAMAKVTYFCSYSFWMQIESFLLPIRFVVASSTVAASVHPYARINSRTARMVLI